MADVCGEPRLGLGCLCVGVSPRAAVDGRRSGRGPPQFSVTHMLALVAPRLHHSPGPAGRPLRLGVCVGRWAKADKRSSSSGGALQRQNARARFSNGAPRNCSRGASSPRKRCPVQCAAPLSLSLPCVRARGQAHICVSASCAHPCKLAGGLTCAARRRTVHPGCAVLRLEMPAGMLHGATPPLGPPSRRVIRRTLYRTESPAQPFVTAAADAGHHCAAPRRATTLARPLDRLLSHRPGRCFWQMLPPQGLTHRGRHPVQASTASPR